MQVLTRQQQQTLNARAELKLKLFQLIFQLNQIFHLHVRVFEFIRLVVEGLTSWSRKLWLRHELEVVFLLLAKWILIFNCVLCIHILSYRRIHAIVFL